MSLCYVCRDVIRGWAGWALAHPEFGVSVNPIPTVSWGSGADYTHHITASPPGFENLTTSLVCDQERQTICQHSL